jgi:hypothetical protein
MKNNPLALKRGYRSHRSVIPSVAQRSRGIFGFERPEKAPVEPFQREWRDSPVDCRGAKLRSSA